MKIVFLDIDGVLNSPNTNNGIICPCLVKMKNTLPGAQESFRRGIDVDKVLLLNQLLESPSQNIGFILSSNWRWCFDIPHMQQILMDRGFRGILLGKTGNLERESRGLEIEDFLNQHKDKIQNYVVLDDLNHEMNQEILNHLVQTDPNIGLTQNDINKAKNILLNL
jgi:hypothetical protein